MLLVACGQGGGEAAGSAGSGTHHLSVRFGGNGSGAVRATSPQIECNAQCSQDLAANVTVKLAATPDASSTFSGWQGACSGTGDCTVTMDADKDVTAMFTALPPPPPGKARVTVSLVGNGSGRVTSSPQGIDCPGACTMLVDSGTLVSLAPQPDDSSRFVGWGGGCSGPGACGFAASADATVWANFDVKPGAPIALDVTVNGPGEVTSDPAGIDCTSGACSATFPGGVPIVLHAAPQQGARFAGWSGACSGSGSCSLTLTTHASVSASFEAEMVELASDAGAGSTIALNSSDVFYASQQAGAQDPPPSGAYTFIRAVPKAGGTPRLVAVSPAPVASIRANDSFVYWTTTSVSVGVYRAPADGGATEVVFRGSHVSDIALDDANVYFGYLPQDGARDGTVYAAPISGGAPVALATGFNPWNGIAVDSTDVWFGDNDAGQVSLLRVAKQGGNPSFVLTMANDGGAGFPSIRTDSTNVYVRTAQGALFALDKKSNSTTAIAAPGGTGTDLDVNASVLYWNVDWDPRGTPDPSPQPGIVRANADGSGVTYVDTEKLAGWSSPRVDDRYLFYVRGTSVVRRSK